MDCIERQIRHDEPNRVWFESDGFCCDMPCAGYQDYELKQQNRGFGCLTQEVNNELIVGDFCASNDNDLNCQGGQSHGSGGNPTFINPENPNDPIIIDLGHDSYRLTSVADGVQFDVRNDGRAVRTAWTRTGAENAFLALDRNTNGRIDSGAELLGNFSPLRSGALAQNGYEVLAEFDDNGDNVVDAADGVWAKLLLWTDRNHDGASTADELQSVSASVVVGFEIERRFIGRKDQWGNQFRYMAHARIAHARRPFYDVFLGTD